MLYRNSVGRSILLRNLDFAFLRIGNRTMGPELYYCAEQKTGRNLRVGSVQDNYWTGLIQ